MNNFKSFVSKHFIDVHKIKYLVIVLCTFIIFLNCKKRKEPLSWNTQNIIPLSSDTLDFKNLFGFPNLKISEVNNCAVLNDTIEVFKFKQEDFLPELDFTLTDTLEVPSFIFGFPFPPNFEIPYNFTNNKDFSFEDIQLTEIKFKDLKINYTIKSNIDGAFYFNLNIPTAKNINGETFNNIIDIPNSNGQMNTHSGEVFLDNYTFDLSNEDSTFNNIRTSIRIGCSAENSNDIVLNSNNFLSITISLNDLNVSSIKGYLGSINLSDTSSTKLPFMEKLSSDNVSIENPQLELILKNGLGLDAQISINEVEFLKNESSYFLQHPTIGEAINITRALDLGWDFQYTNKSILFDNQNSNFHELLGVFPENINIKYQLQTNPLGNHSGYNDFYNSNHTLEALLGVNIPLKLNLNNLKYTDTISISIPKEVEANSGIIHLEFENEIPVNCCLHINIPDGDSLIISPNCINSSNTDNLGNVSSPGSTKIQIQIDNQRFEQIMNKKKLLFSMTLNSPDTSTFFPISENQKIKYKIGLELNSSIYLK